MKQLHDKVNIIPVLAKADTMTPEEVAEFKKTIMEQITGAKIKIYEFPEMADGEEVDRKENRKMKERVPFAVVGSNMIMEVDGKKTRGRKYPWGVVDIENLSHCDFVPLRNMLVRTHLMDLKDVTNYIHYENYRCRKLAGITGTDKVKTIFNGTELFVSQAFWQNVPESAEFIILFCYSGAEQEPAHHDRRRAKGTRGEVE